MINLAANKGEWSELYTIGYLIVHGGGYGADADGAANRDLFYKVLKIIDNPTGNAEMVYELGSGQVKIFRHTVLFGELDRATLDPILTAFFNDLSAAKGSSFSMKTGTDLMKLICKDKLSASSTQVVDLNLILEDNETGIQTPKRAFSIKSELGEPATIFNASRSTNIIYEIFGPGTPGPFSIESGVKTNLINLINSGFNLKFSEYQSPIFESSLKAIDSNLAIYLAELTQHYYLSKLTRVKDISLETFPPDDAQNQIKIQKIKKFLSAISMGLRANQPWTAYPQDFGGLLLVKLDGDVLFYYLYNIKDFEEYLFNNLRFETPSASRHGFGEVFQRDGKNFIKLNLQIRY